MVLELWVAGMLVGSSPVFGAFESEYRCSQEMAEAWESPQVVAVSDCVKADLTFKIKEPKGSASAPSVGETPDGTGSASAPAAEGSK